MPPCPFSSFRPSLRCGSENLGKEMHVTVLHQIFFFLMERCFEQGVCVFRYLLLYPLHYLLTEYPDSVLSGDLFSFCLILETFQVNVLLYLRG